MFDDPSTLQGVELTATASHFTGCAHASNVYSRLFVASHCASYQHGVTRIVEADEARLCSVLVVTTTVATSRQSPCAQSKPVWSYPG